MKSKNVLFLCAGNYYRSRFAELLFNHLAPQHDLDWSATSRGLALELGTHNVGSISQHALAGLFARAIVLGSQVRHPLALNEGNLSNADHNSGGQSRRAPAYPGAKISALRQAS